MTPFLSAETFLLPTETARELYHTIAARLPIADWHCHLPVSEIAEDAPCGNIAQLWLAHDHYKWRAMRCLGVPESHITGVAADWDKFAVWAACIPQLIGSPLYHWTHLELRRFFGINEPLNPDTARNIYARANEQLANMTVRDLLRISNVELLCTTDDPASSLIWHEKLRDEYAAGSFGIRVLPAFRADNLLYGGREYLDEMSAVSGIDAHSEQGLADALSARADAFSALGCRAADFSAPNVNADNMEQIRRLTKICADRNWVLETHLGVMRNVNPRMLAEIGKDAGGDTIKPAHSITQGLFRLFEDFAARGQLPKTILFSLNPADNAVITALCGCFGDKLRQGSAWWFNDSLPGMRAQLSNYAAALPLATFPGFVTDSRSFLSFPRHEYFRRLFCGMLGDWVERGEYPRDWDALERLVRGVCHDGAMEFFGF
ncbi:MAG: glucuronate isomerase [Oscillospiraceae bacterium]|jgi:glucuronate isomerase|nr:glucuronate isomerase [Oscillospiraceae bacterium]